MSRSGGISAATYARRIERRWSELLEQPLIFSPRDWSIVSAWHARGVALEIVCEAMEAAIERARARGRPPRAGLAYLAPAVDEAWASVVSGRLGVEHDAPAEHAPAPARDAWRRRIAAEPASPLAGLLSALLTRLEAGEPGARLDRELDDRLPEVGPAALIAQLEPELERELAPHRGRIPPDRLATTRARALIDRLRQRLQLPRLAGDGPDR